MRHLKIIIALLINFIIFGISLTIIGATLPKIIADFHWSYVLTGIVLAAGSIGYFASSFISGILLHRLGPKLVIVIGLGLQSIGLLFFASTPFAWINMLLNLMIGFGQGGTEVVVNYSVVKIEQGGKSRLMNLMHASFSVGAVIGPYIVIFLMKIGQDWQTIYRLMGIVSIILAGIFFVMPFSHISKSDDNVENKIKVSRLIKDPVLILSFLILFVYVGSELGVSNWVSEFYVKFFNKSPETGALMVSIFWIGLLIGRLGTSIFYKGSKPALVALGLSITCTVALLFALISRHHIISGIGFIFTGLGYSAIYPLIMALVGRYFSEGQGAAVGFAATGGGVGAFVFPFIMSAISQAFGIYKGFFFYFALNITMTGLIIAIIVISKRLMAQKSKEIEN